MIRKLSSILAIMFVSSMIPLTFTGCGSGGNSEVTMDASLDTAAIEAAEAKAAAEELAPTTKAP